MSTVISMYRGRVRINEGGNGLSYDNYAEERDMQWRSLTVSHGMQSFIIHQHIICRMFVFASKRQLNLIRLLVAEGIEVHEVPQRMKAVNREHAMSLIRVRQAQTGPQKIRICELMIFDLIKVMSSSRRHIIILSSHVWSAEKGIQGSPFLPRQLKSWTMYEVGSDLSKATSMSSVFATW